MEMLQIKIVMIHGLLWLNNFLKSWQWSLPRSNARIYDYDEDDTDEDKFLIIDEDAIN